MRSLFRSTLFNLIIILNFFFSGIAYSDNHNIYEILDLIKKDFRIIQIFGDQLDDFIPLQKTATNITSRKALIDQYSDMWGEKWYMLINPMYGEWEEALYEHCWSCFPEESDRVIQRLKALD